MSAKYEATEDGQENTDKLTSTQKLFKHDQVEYSVPNGESVGYRESDACWSIGHTIVDEDKGNRGTYAAQDSLSRCSRVYHLVADPVHR